MTINTKCSTQLREQCGECYVFTSDAEHEKLTLYPTISLSPFDQITKVDWQCQHHGDSRFMWACVECVKEQLAKEYERGRKAAQPESETIKELRETLDKAHERVSIYYREKCDLEKQLAAERKRGEHNFQSRCDLEKDYATLKQHHEKAREQIEFAHGLINMVKDAYRDNGFVLKSIKEWEAL